MKDKKILHGLNEFQPLLDVHENGDETVIQGTYQVNETIIDVWYFDNFDVKIIITSKYPLEIPQVFVDGSRLDICEHKYSNGMLCLETVHILKSFLKKKPSISEFLVKFLTPFFVNFIHYEKHGVYLFGERKHGDAGIIQMYQERFSTKDIYLVLCLLEIITRKKYRGHLLCPCKSGNRIRYCHGKNGMLINMINSPDQELYKADYNNLMENYRNSLKKQGS